MDSGAPGLVGGERARAAVDALARTLAAGGAMDPYFEAHRSRFVHDLELVERLHVRGRILEVGTYPDYFSYCLKWLGYDAIGVDLDPSRNAAFHRANHLTVVRCDIETQRFPFEDGWFAVVLLCEVFEHLRTDPIRALREIHRILAPGGTLVVQTPNLYSLGNVARFVTGRGVMPDAHHEFAKLRGVGHMGHIREYTRAEMREFMVQCGFTVTEAGTRVHRASRTGWLTDVVYRMLPPFRPFQLIVARKEDR